MEKEVENNRKKLTYIRKKVIEAQKFKKDNDASKEKLKFDFEDVDNAYKKIKKVVDEEKKLIEEKKRERDLLNKDVATAESEARDQDGVIQTENNELLKLQNKITGYRGEVMKLHKMIRGLESDKSKYGVEASQANAKYYENLEKVKIKNNLIQKL